jgi:hypothetical protein
MNDHIADVAWNTYREQYTLQIREELLKVSKKFEILPPLESNNYEVYK